ncbi:MAG: hypothetical protein GY838_04305 [bacterium]|nr:hypothetical protein [bacterium]
MRHRIVAILLVAMAAAAILAACSDDDPTEPGGGCVELTFDDILPTDDNGDVIGSGGVGDWCWPDAGSDPSEPYLYPAFPNPFNSANEIQFALPSAGHVYLRVVDSRCRVVRVLLDADRDFGTWSVTWDGEDEGGTRQGDGLYGVILTVGNFRCSGVIEMKSVP